jgi:hypothetical protein
VTTSSPAETAYDLPPRRISGTRDEKLELIDAAIHELIELKTLECAADRPNGRCLAVPRARRHAFAMTVTILVLLIVLVWLVGGRASQPDLRHARVAYSSANR